MFQCTFSSEIKIDLNDAMRMLDYINKSIRAFNEHGAALSLDRFLWMLVGKCQFVDSAAVEMQRIVLLYKLEQMVRVSTQLRALNINNYFSVHTQPQAPRSEWAKSVYDFMVYLQDLILMLNERQHDELVVAGKPKKQQAKPIRKKVFPLNLRN
jgi:hypothetical protein